MKNQFARILILVLCVSVAAALVLSYVQYRRFQISGIHTVYDLTYVDGNLIRNIAERGQYRVCGTQVVQEWGSMCFSAHRLPLIPLAAAAAAALVTPNIAFLLVAKNVLAVTTVCCVLLLPILVSTVPVTRKALRFIPIALALGSPIVINTLGQLEYEEAYALPLFVVAYAVLESYGGKERLKARTAVMCACLILLALMKSTYFLVDFVLAGVWFLRERARTAFAVLPLAGLTLALLAWGVFSYHESGHFAFGSSMSSFNGANLYKGNNPYTMHVYPYYLDELDKEALLKPDEPVRDEWELNAYYERKTRAFVESHPVEALQLIWIKFKTLFLSYDANGTRRGLTPAVEWFFLPAKLVLQMGICVALWSTFRLPEDSARGLTFMSIVGAYSLPLIIGFGYDRHLVIPSVIAAMYLSDLIGRSFGSSIEHVSVGRISPAR